MHRQPPHHRILDDKNIRQPHQTQYGASPSRAILTRHAAAQRNYAEIQKQLQQRGGRAAIPDPPCAPGWLAPHAAAEQRQCRHRCTDRRGGGDEPIRHLHAPHQEHQRGGAHHHVDGLGKNRRGHVHVNDAHAVVLLIILGRKRQAPHAPSNEQNNCRNHQPRQPTARNVEEPPRRTEAVKPFLCPCPQRLHQFIPR